VSSSIGIARLGIMLGVGVMVRVVALGVDEGRGAGGVVEVELVEGKAEGLAPTISGGRKRKGGDGEGGKEEERLAGRREEGEEEGNGKRCADVLPIRKAVRGVPMYRATGTLALSLMLRGMMN
jgi:hypothetical protein